MKEDVLEQIVDDYLQLHGYFTIHNVRFRPSIDHPDYKSSQDSVRSDVDIVGINPKKREYERVWVVSCKAWQGGFKADRILRQLNRTAPQGKRETWRYYRELWVPKWSEAFRAEIEARTGSRRFHYWIAVTRLVGDGASWSTDPRIMENLNGNPFGFLTLERMWSDYLAAMNTTPHPSEIGRLAQLLKAARLTDSG